MLSVPRGWDVPFVERTWRTAFQTSLRDLVADDARLRAFSQPSACAEMQGQIERRAHELSAALRECKLRVLAATQDYLQAQLPRACRSEEGLPVPDRALVGRWLRAHDAWRSAFCSAIGDKQRMIDREHLSDVDARLEALTKDHCALLSQFASAADLVFSYQDGKPGPDAEARQRAMEALRASLAPIGVDVEIQGILSLEQAVQRATEALESSTVRTDDPPSLSVRNTIVDSNANLDDAKAKLRASRAGASARTKQYFDNQRKSANLRQLEQWHADINDVEERTASLKKDARLWAVYKEVTAWNTLPTFPAPFNDQSRSIDLVEFAKRIMREMLV